MLAVIIVNYRNEPRTIEYVRQELSKISVPHKIVVVNNGATDETDTILAEGISACIVHDIHKVYPQADCYVISNLENAGFAKGNNLGAEFAHRQFRPDVLLFSNNDIRFLSNDVAEKLMKKLYETPEAGIIGPKVVGLKGELQSPEPFHSFWDRHVWMYLSTPFYSKTKKKQRFGLDYAQTAQEGFHYKVMGSFFMVRTEDFFRCGMMDPHTFLYAEETILTERMKRIGKKVYYYPNVAVFHEHGATTGKHLKQGFIQKVAFQSECYYYRKYIGTNPLQIAIGKLCFKLLSIIR